MSSDEEAGPSPTTPGKGELPVVPAATGAPAAADPPLAEGGAPEALGFNLRFEGGKALLSLERCGLVPGLTIDHALFEVPDVDFPLDASGGAHRFQDKRLTLRAVELTLDVEELFLPEKLAQGGLTLLRQRSRAGGVEVLFSTDGPSGPVPIRARGLFVAAGDAGLAAVLHEVIPFGRAPRSRLDLAGTLLDALQLPGGRGARGMVRRAEVFRSVFGRLLPSFGWKVPAMGAVRIHEANLVKTGLALRAWSGERPDGWKKPRAQRVGPLEDTVALAVFADDLADAGDAGARLKAVDRVVDAGAPPAALVPFIAEILRADDRRRHEGDDLVKEAAERHEEHLGVLSALVDEDGLDDDERRKRLLALGEAAEEVDEVWVSSRAFLSAAQRALAVDDRKAALEAAELAYDADPALGDAGVLCAELLAAAGEDKRALSVGRQTLERIDDDEVRAAFLVGLAPIAARAEGADAARKLLRAALRSTDRLDALTALLEIEIQDGHLDRAAELLTRLLASAEDGRSAPEQARVLLLAADLAEARGQHDEARTHLSRARELAPDEGGVAVRLARVLANGGEADRAIETLTPLVENDPVDVQVAIALARLILQRGGEGDPRRAREVLGRLDEVAAHDRRVRRLDAEARAFLGDVEPLADLVRAEANEAEAGASRVALLADAARLFVRAGATDHLASIVADAIAEGDAGADAVVDLLQSDIHDMQAVAAAAWVWSERGGAVGVLRSLAGRVRSEHPRTAYHLLLPCTDTADRLTRMELMHEVGDVAGELDEARAALNVLDVDDVVHRPTLAARVGSLHLEEGGGGPVAAVVAFAEAHRCGADVADAWLHAALLTEGTQALGEVLMATPADPDRVTTDRLRDVLSDEGSVGGEERRPRRLALRRALAMRALDEVDVRAYVDDLARQAPIAETGMAWMELGERADRADWVAEGARLLAGEGEGAAGLEKLMASLTGEGQVGEAAVRYAFELACEHGTSDDIWLSSERLLPLVAEGEASEVHARRTSALEGRDADRWEAALVAWLGAEPSSTPALAALVPRQLARGDLDGAVQRLRAAADGDADGVLGPGARHLVRETVGAAERAGDVEAEVAALELFLLEGELDEQDVPFLERLADHAQRLGRYADAVAALLRRLDVPGPDAELADASWRAARLLIDEVEAPHRAAEVLQRRAAWAPDDLTASSELVRLYEALGDIDGHRVELERRLSRLDPGPERTASLVSLGDLCRDRLEQPGEAVKVWLRALRSRPYSEAAHKRLVEIARGANDHRLAVRIHLAAARSLDDDRRAADAASEAGALLAGLLMRPRAAAAAYEVAASRSPEPGPSLRALIEIWRALEEKERALEAAERYVDSSDGAQRALALEVKADVLERLMGDAAAAAVLRREALVQDPTLRVSALSLERYLRELGDVRDAIAVRRTLAEASEAPSLQAQTLASLSASAESDASDVGLAAELAAAALERDPNLRSLRVRLVDLLERLDRTLDATEHLAVLVDDDALGAAERVSFARRKAQLEREGLMDAGAARRTLTAALGRAPQSDVLARDLADVLEELDEPGAAAGVLAAVLDEHEGGTEALGPRERVLERIAELLEDAGQLGKAMDALDEAAGLAPLTRAGELRRARLAEARGAFSDAVLSLRNLAETPGVDAEEHIALLGRLALAAEKAEQLPDALSAWQKRLERLPTDRAALRAIERLGVAIAEPHAARSASLALLGDEEEPESDRFRRLLWLARDARDRLDDAPSAVGFLEQARAIHDEASVRRELYLCAESALAEAVALEALDGMVAAGDDIDPRDRLRRAELRAEAAGDVETALDDAVLAAEALGEDARVGEVIGVLAQRDPDIVAQRLLAHLAEHDIDTVVQLLRGRLPVERVQDADALAALADRLPTDSEIARAAAAASERTGDVLGAADRLITLGAQEGQTEALDQAAQLLADADVEVGAWLSRIEVLRDAIAVDSNRRASVLRVLRDAEAWTAVVDLLEAGAVVEDGAERRRLRMEAVAILRAGLDDAGRAADILDEVLADDGDDREAWGELLEALEALGDRERLERALARRTEGAAGIERRELVKRRAALLLELGRGVEALEPLASVRAEAPDDEELKALQREVFAQRGEEELLAFHAEELLKTGSVDDARVVLGAKDADPALRAEATLALVRAEAEPLSTLVDASLRTGATAGDRGAELAAIAAGLEGESLATFVDAVTDALPALGSRPALQIARAMAASGGKGLSDGLALATIARARRVEGPRAALRTLREVGAQLDEVTTARIWLHLAPRGGDAKAFSDAAEAAELSEQQRTALDLTRRSGDGPVLVEQLQMAGQSWNFESASGVGGLVALVRHGDVDQARARLTVADPPTRAAVAARCRWLPLTPARLALRAQLQSYLPEDERRGELAALEALAATGEDPASGAAVLDAAIALLGATAARAEQRAELAVQLEAPDAAEHLERAASLAEDPAKALQWRRQVVERLVRTGASGETLADALLRWVATAPEDAATLRDAMVVAEATQLDGVVDELLGALVGSARDESEALDALERRVALRQRKLKDPAAAISVLLEASNKYPEAGLRRRALELAIAEGLVEHQIALLDDPLARAGLLGALGRYDDALSAAGAVDGLPGALLRAEIAALRDDVDAERRALEEASAFAEADVQVARRTVALSDGPDAVVHAALTGLKRFPSDAGLALALAQALDGADDEVVRGALGSIREQVVDRAEGQQASAALVEAWAAASARLGDEQDATAALLELARRNDDDASWTAYLSRRAQQVDAAALWEEIAPHLARRAVMLALATAAPGALVACLRHRLDAGELGELRPLIAALDDEEGLPGAFDLLIVDVYEAAGDLEAAARRLARWRPATAGDLADKRLRLARWALTREAVDEAAAELLALPLRGFDEEARSLAVEVIARSGAAGLPLAVRLASASSAEAADVDRVLALAEQHDDDAMVAAVAAWRLKEAPGDTRAWQLAASHGEEQARAFFAGQLSLRGEAVDRSLLSEPYLRAREIEAKAIDLEPSGSGTPATTLAQARSGPRETRSRAWKELADQQARDGQHLTAARLLARAGLSLTDAPIELRLAVDPDLAGPAARVAAIAEVLPSIDDPHRQSQLTALFSDLDERGWAGARQRAAVFRDDDAFSSAALIDAADLGQGVALGARLRSAGRSLSLRERTTLGALAFRLGQAALGRALHPGLETVTRPSASDRLNQVLLDRVDEAKAASDPLRALGLMRLRIAQKGTTPAIELELQALAEAAGRWDLVAESLGREAALHEDADTRAARLASRAKVALEQLGRPEAALADARFAASLRPDDRLLADLWIELARACEDWGELATALSQLERLAANDDERVERVLERSAILRSRLDAPGGALAALDGALTTVGPKAALLVERARCLMQLDRNAEAGEALLTAAGAEQDTDGRHALRREAAALFLDGDDRDRALQALLLSAREGDDEALVQAEEQARAHDLFGPLAAVLEQRRLRTDDESKRRSLTLEQAQILAEHVGDRAAAIALLEAQAVADAGDIGARLRLAEWYLLDRRLLDAALAYESAATIPNLPEVAIGPPAREAACLLSALGDLERAGPLAEQAIDCGVVDLKVLAVAFAFHRAHEDWPRVDEVLGREIDLIEDPRDAAHLWMDRAALRRDHLGDDAGARQAMHRVLELRPDHEEALAAMRDDAVARDSYGALRAALSRAVDQVDNADRRVGWLLEIATLDDEQFHDLKAAEATIDRALAYKPEDAELLVKKGVLKVKRGDVEGLPDILERAEAAGATTLPGMLQLVRGDALLISGERDAAVSAFEAAAGDPEVADRAWDRLLDLAEGLGDDAALQRQLSAARQVAQDAARRVRLARREARLGVKLADEDAAADAFEALLVEEPGDTEALKALRDIFARRRRLERLDPLFEAWARSPEDPVEAGRRLAEFGAFVLDELGSESRARDVFQDALERNPDEQGALVRLATIAYGARELEQALELLDRVRPEMWPRGAIALAFERAECAVAIGANSAADRVRDVLRQEPKHIGALELLLKRALDDEDDETAEFALTQLAGAVDVNRDPVRAAKVFGDLARMHLKQEWVEPALDAAEQALELRPSAVETLQLVAEVREQAGKLVDAAEAWRRLESIGPADKRVSCRLERARLLEEAGVAEKAAEAWRDAYALSGDDEHLRRADALVPAAPAMLSEAEQAALGGNPALVEETIDMGDTAPMQAAPGEEPEQTAPDFNALPQQAQGLVDDGLFAEAVAMLSEAFEDGRGDADLASLGVKAARGAKDPQAIVFFCEERLKGATDKQEVQELALEAGRAARDGLQNNDKAADLLYVAHQAAPDDLDTRLELTDLYARIPRLVRHAQTGVLQLLRRAPVDARIYRLGAFIAEQQEQSARQRNLQAVASLLDGSVAPVDLLDTSPLTGWAPEMAALDDATVSTRITPEGFSKSLQALIRGLSSSLEEIFLSDNALLASAKRIGEVSGSGDAMAKALTSLVPGKPVKPLCGEVDKLSFAAGTALHVVFPERWFEGPDRVKAARLGRGIALARLGGVLAEALSPAQLGTMIMCLQVVFRGRDADAFVASMAERLRGNIDEQTLAACTPFATQALPDAGPDLKAWVDAVARAGDRFGLLASGSVVAALVAGPLPELLEADGQTAAAYIRANRRALDLCAYAARDNVWAVRDQRQLPGR